MGRSPLLSALTASVIFLALLFGGGTTQGLGSDALVQLASLPLLGAAGWRLASSPLPSPLRVPLTIAGAILLLPILQLIPLPPSLWSMLPGREPFVEMSAQLGFAPSWHPISLDPAATWRAWLSLLPPVAVFLALVSLNLEARRVLSLLLVGIAILALLLGLAQLMQGPGSPLRFYPVTNVGSSVGFFANRNHHAALLYCAGSFAAAWMIGLVQVRRVDWVLGAGVCGLILAVLLLGVGMAQSRAGVFLAVVGIGLALLIAAAARPGPLQRRGILFVAAASVLGIVFVLHYALGGLMDRFEASPIEDYRFAILGIAVDAARTFQPLGSGFGTFEAVYLLHDRPDALLSSYVNHAHNDWVEIWIEGGWLAVALAAVFLVWFARATVRAWRDNVSARPIDAALRYAASINICLLLLHSLVDYPLRTTGLTVVFALCCGMLVKPLPAAERAERKSVRTTRSTRSERLGAPAYQAPDQRWR